MKNNFYLTIYEVPEETEEKEEKWIKENTYKFTSLQNSLFYTVGLLRFELLPINNKNETINDDLYYI